MINTIVTMSQQAELGMPASGRVRMASLRALPKTTGDVWAAAGHKCVISDRTDVWTLEAGYRQVDADVFAVKGAFPGTSAWSPPI